MLDLPIAYGIYPGVPKVPAAFTNDKLKLSTLCLPSFKKALRSLRDYLNLSDGLVKMVEFTRKIAEADSLMPYEHLGTDGTANGSESRLIRPFGDHHWGSTAATFLTLFESTCLAPTIDCIVSSTGHTMRF